MLGSLSPTNTIPMLGYVTTALNIRYIIQVRKADKLISLIAVAIDLDLTGGMGIPT